MADSGGSSSFPESKETESTSTEAATAVTPQRNITNDDTSGEARGDAAQVTTDPAPPPKPPRPLSRQAQAEKTLSEAFPSIDATVVKAVLSASGGAVEPAFDALLGMTDPDSQKGVQPPPKPTRPIQPSGIPTSTAQSQLEADEQYARQLEEHYSSAGKQQGQNLTPYQEAPRQPGQISDDREYSFLDDDLPVIRDNIRKGFLETQSTVNKWVSSLKKKLDGEDDEGYINQPGRPAQGSNSGTQAYPDYSHRSSEIARRSADRERYDADPRVLGDDFSSLELKDTEVPAKKPQRPVANPDLFRSGTPTGSRHASFPKDDSYSEPPRPVHSHPPAGKSSKWQPLSTVEPSPVAEHDPFSLGDSDDDKETKLKDNKSGEPEPPQTPGTAPVISSTGEDVRSDGVTKPGLGTEA